MGRLNDLIGKKFGRLTVIERAENGRCGGKSVTRWRCICDCGNEITTEAHSLVRGRTKSCGCLNTESRQNLCLQRSIHGGSNTRIYHIWASMKQRCTNKNSTKYPIYGGRGITYCSEWEKFEPFRKWALSNGYNDELTIDRIDTNGNYFPENCRWATWHEQRMNQRRMLA